MNLKGEQVEKLLTNTLKSLREEGVNSFGEQYIAILALASLAANMMHPQLSADEIIERMSEAERVFLSSIKRKEVEEFPENVSRQVH